MKNAKWVGNGNGPPIVVHCSGGIGRTGTFQCIDICFKRLIASGRIDVAGTVKRLRAQRSGSVQSYEQYLFIYLVVLQLIKNDALMDKKRLFKALSSINSSFSSPY